MGTLSGREFSDMNDFENRAGAGRQPVALAVETSSRIGSVALAIGDHVIEEVTFSTPMQHSAEIFPAIQDLLIRHSQTTENIDQVHIAIGPGSFTGLRIAAALAKAMHLAQGIRIVTVDSLDVVIANLAIAPENEEDKAAVTPLADRIAALFDAKRGQFYASIYEHVPAAGRPLRPADTSSPGYEIPGPGATAWRKTHPDSLMTVSEIANRLADAARPGVLGDGLLYHREEFTQMNATILPERYWSPRAANVHRLARQKASAGRFADPLGLIPFYLRAPQVTLKGRP